MILLLVKALILGALEMILQHICWIYHLADIWWLLCYLYAWDLRGLQVTQRILRNWSMSAETLHACCSVCSGFGLIFTSISSIMSCASCSRHLCRTVTTWVHALKISYAVTYIFFMSYHAVIPSPVNKLLFCYIQLLENFVPMLVITYWCRMQVLLLSQLKANHVRAPVFVISWLKDKSGHLFPVQMLTLFTVVSFLHASPYPPNSHEGIYIFS